jgi:hypothetical protein
MTIIFTKTLLVFFILKLAHTLIWTEYPEKFKNLVWFQRIGFALWFAALAAFLGVIITFKL